MNLFKKIFGKKEEQVSNEGLQPAEKEILKEYADKLTEIYSKDFADKLNNMSLTTNIEEYKQKHYKIPELIKTAKNKLTNEGIQSCIDYITTILNDTEKLQKDQSISLTRNLVAILKDNNHESINDFNGLLNSCLSKYNVLQDPLFYHGIAKIYSELSLNLAIVYITNKNAELLNNQQFKSLNYHLLIYKIELLVKLGELIIAEKEIEKSNDLIENNTMFQFISDKIKSLNLLSEIARKNSDFKSVLKYEILIFILDTTNDLSGYPITLDKFLYRKNLILNGEHGLNYNYITKNFPEKFTFEDQFNKIKEEVYYFIYNDLPTKIGIHPAWLEKSYTTEQLIATFGKDWYSKFKKITDAPFEHYKFIETFVNKIIYT